MNYKKIIPSRDLRLKILALTEFIPDEAMIKMQYKIATGRKLDLKNPKRFTEKLQWYKLFYRDPLMTQCADKYRARDYVREKGLSDILVPLYGVYDRADDIDFDQLPNEFVLKINNASQTNILCKNKNDIDQDKVREKLETWLKDRTVKAGREWPYYNIEPKIICEKFLDQGNNDDLIDYKFMCFNGKVRYLIVNAERDSEDGMIFNIYNRDFEYIPYGRKGLRRNKEAISKPLNYERMIEIAEILSEDFPHVRVDLYNIDGTIYFGELTFFHGSGYVDFEPDEFDFILGDQFEIPEARV